MMTDIKLKITMSRCDKADYQKLLKLGDDRCYKKVYNNRQIFMKNFILVLNIF